MRQRVLCVVAHPDDETLGVGGTLALHAEAGSDVKVLIMSEGEVEKLRDTPRCDTRRECARRAAEFVGQGETNDWFGGPPTVIVVFPDDGSEALVELDRVLARK